VQIADVGGVYVLSFVLALTSAALVETIVHRDRRPLVGALGAIAAVALYGTFRLSVPLPREPEVPVMVVQGNVDVGSQWRRDLYGEGLGQYLRLSADRAAETHPRLIVWPESAVTFFLDEEPTYLGSITRVLRSHGADLVLGGPRRDGHDERFFNSAFYVTADGHIAVATTRCICCRSRNTSRSRTIHFLRPEFGRNSAISRIGRAVAPHPLRHAATLICFEAIFPKSSPADDRRATFMLNLSNERVVRCRRGATRIMMVAHRGRREPALGRAGRATGVSAIIDPYGGYTSACALHAGTIDGRIVPEA
jgi:apolipoprotein N-acyltransferase